MDKSELNAAECGYKNGTLPSCAPLAVAFVPMQSSAKPAYEPAEALARGTLFPGLDLPFMNMINKTPGKSTPLTEVMALDFVLDELELYLDTHKNDAEAFATWKAIAKLSEEAHERYVDLFGPISQKDMIMCPTFTWVRNPWPWDYESGTEV